MKLEGPVGWVYFLGVRPEARRAGLGAGLCLRGLDWASSRGAEVAHLYVDRDDEHATALYERLGFSVDHLDVGYRLDVRAAPGGVRGVTTGACGTKG
jgi:mycothiol synthase